MLTEEELRSYGIDVPRKANLLKLAAYLREVEHAKFDMGDFYLQCDTHVEPAPVHPHAVVQHDMEPNYCNTVACAVGHGPDAGIPTSDTDLGWLSYSRRVFTNCGHTWDFLFSDSWADIDNTPNGAAERIEFLLENGLKDIWDTQVPINDFFESLDKNALPYKK